jgi:hypothetical protein
VLNNWILKPIFWVLCAVSTEAGRHSDPPEDDHRDDDQDERGGEGDHRAPQHGLRVPHVLPQVGGVPGPSG